MGQLKEKTIHVRSGARETTVQIRDDENLYQCLRRHGILLPGPCGGRGSCGKCKVQIQSDTVDVTVQDRKKLSEVEINKGYRLACMCKPKKDCAVILPVTIDERMETVTFFMKEENNKKESEQRKKESKQNNIKNRDQNKKKSEQNDKKSDQQENNPYEQKSRNICSESSRQHMDNISSSNSPTEAMVTNTQDSKKSSGKELGIAIDLGTTTIALALVEGKQKKVLQTHSKLNSQRQFGADVISRITASNQGKLEELKICVREDLRIGIKELLAKSGYELDQIQEIIIAANTTMVHLLMGYSCETLGVYPFTAVNLQWIITEYHQLFGGDVNIPVHILPGISTFVGGDIVAGLYGTKMYKKDKATLMVDLGTNGEMALVTKQGVWVASTAAGPAFEGGNISCGIGGVAGAIKTVKIQDGQLYFDTIENQYPIGICGTGVIELLAELLDYGIVDSEGTLHEDYRAEGIPIGDHFLTQEDIRELQLAKAAIVTGIGILLRKADVTMEEIESFYLAGGFGYYLNKEKAVRIGLIPSKLIKSVEIIGNSSLGGAIEALFDSKALKQMETIIAVSKEIHLAMQDEFQSDYLNAIRFPE